MWVTTYGQKFLCVLIITRRISFHRDELIFTNYFVEQDFSRINEWVPEKHETVYYGQMQFTVESAVLFMLIKSVDAHISYDNDFRWSYTK